MRYRSFAFVVLFLGTGACDDGPASHGAADASVQPPKEVPFSELVGEVHPLTLEESDTALVVKPMIRLDPMGGWIVADVGENQVRLYEADGALGSVLGGEGSGPGEFNRPVAAGRFTDGRLWVVDLRGRVSVFDRTGHEVLWTTNVPITPVYRAWDWPGDSLLIGGRSQLSRESTARLLHVVDPQNGTIARSFFAIPVSDDPAARALALSAGSVDVDIKGDTLAVVFPMVDSVFLMDRNGEAVRAWWIPSLRMRRLSAVPDLSAGFQEVIESFSMVLQVYWVNDGLLVHFADYKDRQRTNGLVHFGRNAAPREVYPAPGLLHVDGNILVFEDTTGVAPNALLQGIWK